MVTTASGPAPTPVLPETTPPAQSEPAPQPVAAPAAAPAPASPVAENQPSPAEPAAGGLPTNLEDIDAFFAGEKPLVLPNSAIEGAPAANPEPAPAPVAAPVTPVVAPVIAATPASAVPVEPVVQRAMDLQKSLNGDRKPSDAGYVKLTEAIGQIEKADAPVAAAPAGPSAVDLAGTAYTTIEADLEALRAERRTLGEDGSFYGPKAVELNEKIEAKVSELSKAERAKEKAEEAAASAQAAQQQSEQSKALAARKSAMDQAAAEFPPAADKTTGLGQRITKMVAEMQNPAHPDHAILFSANAALHVTTMAAKEEAQAVADASKGTITFAQAFDALRAKTPAPSTQQPQVDPEPRRVSPVTGSNGTAAPAAPITEADVLAASLEDPDLIDAALYGRRTSAFVIRG